MQAQFDELKALINFRADATDCKITKLEEKFERTCAELKVVTDKVAKLEHKVGLVEQPLNQMRRRIDELETHSRRCNLRLFGVPESEQEDVRGRVVAICREVLPNNRERMTDYIDVAHRLGTRRRTTRDNTQPRAIIVRFAYRFYRDAVWSAAKSSTYLEENGLFFKADFSKGDRERREKLWPHVDRARAAGKTAYYVGARAFIQGEGEIILTE